MAPSALRTGDCVSLRQEPVVRRGGGPSYFRKISTLWVVFFANFLTQSPVRSAEGAIINPLKCLYYGKIKIAQAPRNRTR